MFWTLTNVNLPRLSLCLQNNKWPHIRNNNKIERFPVTSRQQYSCSKTKKWRPFWCAKTVLWALNSIFMQKSSFVWVNYYWRNALLEDEAACGFSLDLILSTYGMCTVYLHTDSSSEDDEGKTTIQIDRICMFGGMHIWNICNLENTKLNTPKSIIWPSPCSYRMLLLFPFCQ